MTDMTLLADEDIDVALLPIGDFYTMGPADALRAVKLIRPRLTVPMHYNTFQAITQDPEAFAAACKEGGICRQSPSAGGGDDPVSSLGRERAEHHSGCPGTGE